MQPLSIACDADVHVRDAVEASLQISGDDIDNSGDEHAEFLHARSVGDQYEHRYRQMIRVLLVLDPLIGGDEGVELTPCRSSQQVAVLAACPTHPLDGMHLERIREESAKLSRNGLVKQQLHWNARQVPSWPVRALRLPGSATP